MIDDDEVGPVVLAPCERHDGVHKFSDIALRQLLHKMLQHGHADHVVVYDDNVHFSYISCKASPAQTVAA
jgi:hypothetical protein